MDSQDKEDPIVTERPQNATPLTVDIFEIKRDRYGATIHCSGNLSDDGLKLVVHLGGVRNHLKYHVLSERIRPGADRLVPYSFKVKFGQLESGATIVDARGELIINQTIISPE